jgi:hypothetical protein
MLKAKLTFGDSQVTFNPDDYEPYVKRHSAPQEIREDIGIIEDKKEIFRGGSFVYFMFSFSVLDEDTREALENIFIARPMVANPATLELPKPFRGSNSYEVIFAPIDGAFKFDKSVMDEYGKQYYEGTLVLMTTKRLET